MIFWLAIYVLPIFLVLGLVAVQGVDEATTRFYNGSGQRLRKDRFPIFIFCVMVLWPVVVLIAALEHALKVSSRWVTDVFFEFDDE